MRMRESGVEDEVVFREDGNEGSRLRILRGTIVSEDADFVYLQRRDGDWRIKKSLIETTRRARSRP